MKTQKKYVSDVPELVKKWDYEKNGDLLPSEVTTGSGNKVWWICEKGHSYQSAVYHSSKGKGCPYCSGHKVLPGFNDLKSQNPTLANEWNYKKNENILPTEVSCSSNQKVWWTCKKGHEWRAYISNRNKGEQCPYCTGKLVLKGFNDLKTTHPKLASEWNYNKNSLLTPEMVSYGSKADVWWVCENGHEWQAKVYSRVKGNNCPYCSGKKPIKGETDLATLAPYLAAEWDYERNGNLSPSDFTCKSGEKVWWKCSYGHSWPAIIENRYNGRDCPICAKEKHTSFPEQAILFYLKQIFSDTVGTYREINNVEIDIYIPSQKFGIEYDGYYYHKNKEENDRKKTEFLTKQGIRLLRVKETKRKTKENIDISDVITFPSADKISELNRLVFLVLKYIDKNIYKLNTDYDINIERDRGKIYNQYINRIKENSLHSLYPKLANEWNYEKNGCITPEMVTSKSSKTFWWKCKNGHEYPSSISNRVAGRGCPYCANKKVLEGFNDLKTLNPELASQWNHEKNGDLLPTMFTCSSGKEVWWICDKGHEWQARIYSRNSGVNCPYCSGNKVLEGFNDLKTTNPKLASQWNYERNGDLLPTMFTCSSRKELWWVCDKGHEWQAKIYSRNNGCNCPECFKEKRNKRVNKT